MKGAWRIWQEMLFWKEKRKIAMHKCETKQAAMNYE